MLFNGGLVPTYMLYANYLNIKNTIWALIVPGLPAVSDECPVNENLYGDKHSVCPL